MSNLVLDSSALLAVIRREPGSENLQPVLAGGFVSSVNLAEVVAKLTEWGTSLVPLDELLAESQLEIVPFTELQDRLCGELRRETRKRGLSLGDRACLALAIERGLTAVTADAAWVGATAAPIKLIRSAK